MIIAFHLGKNKHNLFSECSEQLAQAVLEGHLDFLNVNDLDETFKKIEEVEV